MSESLSWYEALPSFSDFNAVTEDQWYHEVPDDWAVFMTDIKDSTKAIEAGRYRDVNTLGAASISTVTQALKKDFPYVFGGDGATLLAAPEDYDVVAETLGKLATLASMMFGLHLRVGAISMKDLKAVGQQVRMAKYSLVPGRSVAMFRGGGLNYAVEAMKQDESLYSVATQDAGDLALAGLSCRWNSIPNKKGLILTLLVNSKTSPPSQAYENLLVFLSELFEDDLSSMNPVNIPLLRYRNFRDILKNEKRFHHQKSNVAYLLRVIEIFVVVGLFKYKLPNPFFNTPTYNKSMRVHADYQKFDDMLRMVIDCSFEQRDAIRDYLQKAYEAGQLYYGLHESETSLMTCYVETVEDAQHIHFIDGNDGGYAMAARNMKAQMKA